MRHYLRLSSILLLFFVSCAPLYKGLTQKTVEQSVFRFRPTIDRTLYRCIVDGRFIFKKFHLSGVLFFKQLENGTKRAIYQNEMGIAFFDMEWDKEGKFRVRQVMEEMNKEAVIKTLQKDLEMLLMIGMDEKSEIMLGANGGKTELYRLNRESGYVYYTVEDKKLIKIENTSNRKRVVSVNVAGKDNNSSMPDTVTYKHYKANFTISLTKIERNVNE